MNPPQKPVRPPPPPPVPKDHIVDANKMATPRTDAFSKEYGEWANTEFKTWTEFASHLERELTAANERIRLLIAERDTAMAQVDQQLKLRFEFASLLGTDDVFKGVKAVQALKSKVDYLQNWIRKLSVHEHNTTTHKTWHDDLGWIHPGQCVYIGKEKPEGM